MAKASFTGPLLPIGASTVGGFLYPATVPVDIRLGIKGRNVFERDPVHWRDSSPVGFSIPTIANRLLIDSKLEGGNLLCAFKHRKQLNTYTLFMQNDTNTYGYNQWFYFSVEGMVVDK